MLIHVVSCHLFLDDRVSLLSPLKTRSVRKRFLKFLPDLQILHFLIRWQFCQFTLNPART